MRALAAPRRISKWQRLPINTRQLPNPLEVTVSVGGSRHVRSVRRVAHAPLPLSCGDPGAEAVAQISGGLR